MPTTRKRARKAQKIAKQGSAAARKRKRDAQPAAVHRLPTEDSESQPTIPANERTAKHKPTGSDDIASIYDIDNEGEDVDMTTLDQKRKRGKLIAGVAVLVLLLAGVTYLGFVVFSGSASKDSGVELNITATEKVASGDAVTIEVSYVNNKNVALSEGDIELFLPEGFYIQSTSRDSNPDSDRVWSIEDVQPGTGETIRITGQLVGEKDAVKEISALLTYQPANFSQDFQESATTEVTITSSIVELEVDVPEQVQAGQEFEYKVTYTNASSLPLQNVKIDLTYPELFSVSSTSPEPYLGTDEWRFDELQPGEQQEIVVKGTLDGDSGDTVEFLFALGLLEVDNTFNVQIEKTSVVVVINPELEVFLSAPETVTPGEDVPLTISVNNTSQVDISDVHVELDFEGKLFAEDSYQFDPIESIAAYESAELTHTITLNDNAKSAGAMTITANVVSGVVEGNTVEFSEAAAYVQLQTQGTLDAAADGRYYNDNLKKIGDGPIPPTVGEETAYVIEWTMTAGLNELTNVEMATTLPNNVEWKKDATSGVKYDAASGRVSYTAASLGANKSLTVQFRVSITPEKSDVDSLMVLTEETTVTAVDSATSQQLEDALPRITTDLPNDEGAAGKGVVQS